DSRDFGKQLALTRAVLKRIHAHDGFGRFSQEREVLEARPDESRCGRHIEISCPGRGVRECGFRGVDADQTAFRLAHDPQPRTTTTTPEVDERTVAGDGKFSGHPAKFWEGQETEMLKSVGILGS